MSSASSTGANDPAAETEKPGVNSPSAIPVVEAPELEDPKDWSRNKKWLITAYFSVLPFIYTLGSSVISPAVYNLTQKFKINEETAMLSISLYVLGMAFGTVFAPMSEVYGRMRVTIATWFLFLCFITGSAVAKNAATLLVCRFLAGLFGSSVMSIAAGVINDLWEKPQLGLPMALYGCMAFSGPVFGPITGGYLVQYASGPLSSWRWTQWFLLIFAGVTGANLVWMPETHRATIVRRHERKSSGSSVQAIDGIATETSVMMKQAVWRPIQLLLLDPIVLVMSTYMSFIFGILYLYFGAYQLAFPEEYGWGTGTTGLAFLGIGIGVLISALTSIYAGKLYMKLRTKWPPAPVYPEARLPLTFVASVLAPASVLWFAWSIKKDVHWIVPILSGIPFGWSTVTIFVCLFGYLGEAYYTIGASAIAAATMLRASFAFAFPLIMPKMYAKLHTDWSGTVLGLLLVAFIPIPAVFYKYGPWLRSKSRYSPTRRSV